MPAVASYCTVFLKPEMLHIYRQVTSLERYKNVVITKLRQNSESFPFDPIIELQKPRRQLFNRFVQKHIQKKPAFFYRGEGEILENAIRSCQPDLLHIYFGHTGVHLLPFIENTRLPCVVSFHGADVMPRADRPGYLENLQKLLQVIPMALARSESLAARLRDLGCPAEKIRINRTGIPLDQFPFVDRASRRGHPVRFIQASRLIEKKGLRTTLQAFAEVRRALPESTLVIAGEGPMRDELSTLVAQLGIAPYVQFTGFLEQAALRELYANSDIFVHPSEMTAGSDQEGVPNSMLEAMATGLPVVATRHGGIPEAVEDGTSGWLVSEKDEAALAKAFLELAGDSGERCKLGRAASESVRRNYEGAAQIEKLESYYDEIRLGRSS